MRRGKFKVRSRNSMGILVLIVFLALIPIIICLTELREQHFIFQMICESIKEKPTGAGDVLGISILDTILSTISIAVSVWIGLNIYNVYKKEDIEKLLEQVEKSTEKMVYEGEKRKFLWSLEKGEYMYEICRYMCDQFETLEYVPMDIMKELTFFEKRIYWIYNAYENRRKKECISQAIKALEDVPQLRRRLDILEQPEYSVVSSYLNIRESDLLFYKNIVSSSPNKEEYLKSIEIYKGELEKINKNDKELCGYMQNTIGYTYKLLCEDNTQQKETDIRKENKWYHKLWKNIVRYCIKGEGTTTTKDTENSIEDWKRQAEIYLKKSVENNPKGRYHQNLGAYYATIRDYDKALEQYKLAFNAEKRDDKIYNLIGSVLLYRAEMKLGISERFQKGIVLQLIKEQIIKIDSKIGQLDKRFKYLQDVTIKDLLSFRVPLRTDDRIENALSYEDAEYLILNIKPDYTQSRLYTDMGAIVLSYVVESVTGTDLYNLVRKYILDPCDMKDTVLVIRPEDMGRVVSNNYERRIANNNYCVIRDISKGMVNDGKARKLEKWCPRLYGHAGLFSTAADMGKFASMMLSGNLLDSQFVNKIGVNHTGKKNEDGTFSQFHGLLCYSKNPVAKNSEVNHWLSGNAFALGGYTGNQLTIDYRNQLYIFMASNRCHNRITSVSGMDIVYEAGMTLEWPDGKRYICNKGYAFDRDESVINPAIELAMKWRFLEWLLGSESKVIRC